jgi:uncharacterized protein
MEFQEPNDNEKPFVTAYGDGGFRVLGDRHMGSIIITAAGVQPWSITTPEGIADTDMAPFLALEGQVDVLLVGTGEAHYPPNKRMAEALLEVGISVDFMGTGSACRTFNVLQSDGRQVATALIAID